MNLKKISILLLLTCNPFPLIAQNAPLNLPDIAPLNPTPTPQNQIPEVPSPVKENPPPRATIVEEDTPKTQTISGQLVPRERTQIAILGYHDFTQTRTITEMRMRTQDFANQMEFIHSQGYSVISLQDFLDWKLGQKQLPARCIMITIDDGWKSVYTDAYPILKRYGYPFTLFLYTNYIDNGGSTMTKEMLLEMQKNGASIQSHSTSHPYPKTIRAAKKKGEAAFLEFLDNEMGNSKKKIEELTEKSVQAYCFPGGFNTPEMLQKGEELGYKVMFTVIPKKTTIESQNMLIPRYMVFGTKASTFTSAVNFSDDDPTLANQNSATSEPSAPAKLPIAVTPAPGTKIINRIQPITANLAPLGDIDANSISLHVSGFGKVPATFNPTTRMLTWTPNRPIRIRTTQVILSWKSATDAKLPKSRAQNLEWQFGIDLNASEQLPKIIAE